MCTHTCQKVVCAAGVLWRAVCPAQPCPRPAAAGWGLRYVDSMQALQQPSASLPTECSTRRHLCQGLTRTWRPHHAHPALAAGQAQVCDLDLPARAIDEDVIALQCSRVLGNDTARRYTCCVPVCRETCKRVDCHTSDAAQTQTDA